METDRQHGHGHGQDNDFPHSHWELNSFPTQQSPPLSDYHGFGAYPPPVLPMDPSFAITVPPPYSSLPLTMPSHTWPSMLATHTPFPESGLPATTAPPSASAPPPLTSPTTPAPPPPPRKASTGGTTPRRTLTDEDRRQMCLYHEENKTAKQTDIGVLFGVERSTVSKVLRQKEKYLNPDDGKNGSRSPIKKAKGRVPDIEKALFNWAKNYQRQGFSLTDEMIREKALFFASNCGRPEGKEKLLSTNWLEGFKLKYNLRGPKSRKGSFDTRSEPESPSRLSTNPGHESAIQSPNEVSPTSSPAGFATPSPLSPSQSQDNIKKELTDSLAQIAGSYQHNHSKSTTSIDTSPSFSAGFTSPTSTLLSESPFTPISQSGIPSTDSNSSRPRSQTFPTVMADPNIMATDEPFDNVPPKQTAHQMPTSTLESPLEEQPSPKATGGDASNTIKRNRSNPEIRTKSIYPPTFSKSSTVSPVSSPGSPTQDEARRALELVMNYFQHQPTGLAPQDCIAIGKLMEKLELEQSQQTMLPGGLTRIDELDDAPHVVSRKRSIHEMGWS